jgi:hypothetical protein
MTCPAVAQEVYVHGGVTSQTHSSTGSYAWGLTYLQGLGDYMALSLTYLNEGHVQDHRRDGVTPQFWGRYPLADRKVSLAAGVGPYLYYDTERPSTGDSYSNTHGVGTMLSMSATLYITSHFLFQARGNWIWTPQNANTYVTTLGIGYQFEKAPAKEAPQTLTDKTFQPRNNEVAFLAGVAVLNEYGVSGSSGAGAIEYRRSIGRYFEWSAGWLLEGGFISRNGPMTQIWLGQRFFDDRLSLGVGAGPYLGFDASGGNVTKVNWLLSATASYMLHDHWALRATWSRVATDYDRDTDVILSGISYRF